MEASPMPEAEESQTLEDVFEDTHPTEMLTAHNTYATLRVKANGEPNQMLYWKNIQDYGYPCPRTEYVQSPEHPTLKKLAIKWALTLDLLINWAASQGWKQQRGRFWGELANRISELNK